MVGESAWQGYVHGKGGHAYHACPPATTRYGRSMRGRYASYWNAFLFTINANSEHRKVDLERTYCLFKKG